MVQVYEATAYDKNEKNVSFETHLACGLGETDDTMWLNDKLRPYCLTDDDIHYYFGDGEIAGCAYVDTPEFFYLIGEEIIPDEQDI